MSQDYHFTVTCSEGLWYDETQYDVLWLYLLMIERDEQGEMEQQFSSLYFRNLVETCNNYTFYLFSSENQSLSSPGQLQQYLGILNSLGMLKPACSYCSVFWMCFRSCLRLNISVYAGTLFQAPQQALRLLQPLWWMLRLCQSWWQALQLLQLPWEVMPATPSPMTSAVATGLENPPVLVSVTTIQKKKYTKTPVRLVKDEGERQLAREQEEEQ